MKKHLLIILTLYFVFVLTACSGNASIPAHESAPPAMTSNNDSNDSTATVPTPIDSNEQEVDEELEDTFELEPPSGPIVIEDYFSAEGAFDFEAATKRMGYEIQLFELSDTGATYNAYLKHTYSGNLVRFSGVTGDATQIVASVYVVTSPTEATRYAMAIFDDFLTYYGVQGFSMEALKLLNERAGLPASQEIKIFTLDGGKDVILREHLFYDLIQVLMSAADGSLDNPYLELDWGSYVSGGYHITSENKWTADDGVDTSDFSYGGSANTYIPLRTKDEYEEILSQSK